MVLVGSNSDRDSSRQGSAERVLPVGLISPRARQQGGKARCWWREGAACVQHYWALPRGTIELGVAKRALSAGDKRCSESLVGARY